MQTHHRRHRWLVAAAVAVLMLVTSACGGGSGGGDGVATAGGMAGEQAAGEDTSKKDPQEAALEFARCMREHGVDMPDPQVDDNGRMVIRQDRGRGAAQATEIDGEAHEACRHLLDGVAGPGGAKIDPEEQDRALEFARCMREHGIDMPDPQFEDGGVGFRIGVEGLNPESPAFKAAEEACRESFGPPGFEGGPDQSGGNRPAAAPAGGES